MTVLKQTKKWFRRAKKDLHSARLVAKGREWEDVCFHSQQAVEKALKGYLVQHGTDPPKIHDLVVLVQYCAKFDEVFFQYQKQCAYMSEYAVAFRYVDVEEVEAAEAKQVYRNAKVIYRFCKQKIKDEHNE